MGARPLRRTMQREIEDQLSEKILFGEISTGEKIFVGTEGEGDAEKLVFSSTPMSDLTGDGMVDPMGGLEDVDVSRGDGENRSEG
jgi:ATP-dependent Clp protease ATP-binding subunit ClpC